MFFFLNKYILLILLKSMKKPTHKISYKTQFNFNINLKTNVLTELNILFHTSEIYLYLILYKDNSIIY